MKPKLKKPYTLNIRIEESQYNKLRELSYKSNKSIAGIIRDMISSWLNPGRQK